MLGVFPLHDKNYVVATELFPSGPWTGFYNYSPKDKHRMDLNLTFASGRLDGHGVDNVGRFTIQGSYDAKSLECAWRKTYLGAHAVSYRGFREGKGIWGTWEITQFVSGDSGKGGFHIWPVASEHGAAEETPAEEPVPTFEEGGEIELRRPPAD